MEVNSKGKGQIAEKDLDLVMVVLVQGPHVFAFDQSSFFADVLYGLPFICFNAARKCIFIADLFQIDA